MANYFIVVDSEEKAETLKHQLGGQPETWLIRSNPFQVSLVSGAGAEPVSPRFRFLPAQNEEAFVAKLVTIADREIYLAFDSDQRGEYWAWMISEYLSQVSGGTITPKRLICKGLNREELEQALLDALPVAREQGLPMLVRTLFNSAFSIHLKRLIGTQTGPGNLALTVPSLTTLFFINDRQQEVASLEAEPKWQLSAEFIGASGNFVGRLSRFAGVTADGLLYNESQAKQAIALLQQDSCVVDFVSRTPFTLPPPEPYSLIGLLHDAKLHGGIPFSKAFALIQSLYHGINTSSGRIGLIASYLPFPSGLMPEWFSRLQKEAIASFGSGRVVEPAERGWNRHGLIPLRPEITEESLHGQIDEEACLLYGMIRKRALAGFLGAVQGEQIEAELASGQACSFHVAARRVITQGYLDAYLPPGEDDLLKPCPLADIDTGTVVQRSKIRPEMARRFQDKFYTLESLFADLAEFSIVPEFSTIMMFQDMFDNNYLEMDAKGYLCGTERTSTVVGTLNRVFPSMPSLNLTAYIEQTMVESLSGRKTLEGAISQFHQTLNMHGRALVKPKPQAVAPPPLREQVQARVVRQSSRNVIKVAPPVISSSRTVAEQPLPPAVDLQPAQPAEPESPPVQDNDLALEQTGQEELPGSAAIDSVQDAEAVSVEAIVSRSSDEIALAAEPVPPDGLAAIEEKNEAVFPGKITEPVVADNDAPAEPALPHVAPSEMPVPDLKADSVVVTPDRHVPPVAVRPCPVCGRELLMKEDRYGRFWACSGFPACRHSEAYQEKSAQEMECPVCHSANIMLKRTPTGKDLFVCPQAGCDFVAWSRPYAVACPVCQSPFLVEKKEISGAMILRCPRAGCGYGQAMSGPAVEKPPAADTSVPVKKKVLVRRVGSGASSGGAVRRVRVVKK